MNSFRGKKAAELQQIANSMTDAQLRQYAAKLPKPARELVLEVLVKRGVPAAFWEFLKHDAQRQLPWKRQEQRIKEYGQRATEAAQKNDLDAAAKEIVQLGQERQEEDEDLAEFAGRPHPSVSDGNAFQAVRDLTPNQRKVLDGLKEGFSVTKTARLAQIPTRAARKAAASLHRKFPALPLCTPPSGTATRATRAVSRAQVHNFVVEVALPWLKGTNLAWRNTLDRSKVQKYKQAFLGSGMQEFFELGRRVSVRTTHNSVFLTVKDVWGSSPKDAGRQAWEIAAGAAHELQAVYGFTFKDQIQMRFKGADWALVGHEVALACRKAGVKPQTFVNGQKVMDVDDTPGKSLEHYGPGAEGRATASYRDEEARVFRGLTNENLSQALNEVMQKMGVMVDAVTAMAKSQEVLVKQVGTLKTAQQPLQPQEPKTNERPDYFG